MQSNTNKLNICLAQLDIEVGDLNGNVKKLFNVCKKHQNVDLILTPEFSICGYPPEDLVAYKVFLDSCEFALDRLIKKLAKLEKPNLHVAVSLPKLENKTLYNSLVVINQGKIIAQHNKNMLPNYGVFDEKRYFEPGDEIAEYKIKNQKVMFLICHDIWHDDIKKKIKQSKPDYVAVANASPFYTGVQQDREKHTNQISKLGCTVAYVNMACAQDEHVFDGGSHVSRNGKVTHRLDQFKVQCVEIFNTKTLAKPIREVEQVEKAIVLGTASYCNGTHAKKVFIGVSGGIDSAVVLCIAAQALTPKKVVAVLLPTKITSSMSNIDAKKLAKNLGVEHLVIEIDELRLENQKLLRKTLGKELIDIAKQNLQPRIRANILMSLANNAGGLVLSTGNKSEMATGYTTLYGDMAGAFNPLKDLSKTRVRQLAKHINRGRVVIPNRIITRPPTAELREGQLDSDSLPKYEKLDKILEQIVEELASPNKTAKKFGVEDTKLFLQMLGRSEFKRRQAAIGPNITKRSFGKSWRMPLNNKFALAGQIKDDNK